jgi:predicted cupin superfamily sugar epimerase
MPTADEIIRRLNLQPHPKEGGHFRETYRSSDVHPVAALSGRYGAGRSACTAIHCLLTPGTFPVLHRLRTGEIFFHAGSAVRMLQLFDDGSGKKIIFGPEVPAGREPQALVPRGVWQGLLEPGGDSAPLGCTFSPRFEYAGHEHGRRDELVPGCPRFRDRIERLTTFD